MTKTIARKSLAAIDPNALCDKGFEFELKDPFTEEGLGMFVTVLGPESTKVKAFQRRKVNEQLRAEASGKGKTVTVEDLEEGAIEAAINATVSWRGVVWDEAEGELEFTPENARRLYERRFIREQISEAATTLANFSPG